MYRLPSSFLFLVLLLLQTTVPGSLGATDAQNLVEDLRVLGDRYEGSPGEAQILEFLEAELTSLGARVRKTSLDRLSGAHSFSFSLEAFFQGSREDQMVVAVPLDQEEPGASGGEISLAAALLLARKFSLGDRNLSLRLLFLGGERGTGPPYPLGSRTFLEDFYPPAPAAVLYLDAREPRERLKLHVNSVGRASPIWMIRGVTEAFRTGALALYFDGSHPPLVRLSLAEAPSVLDSFFRREIPGVLFQDGGGGILPEGVWVEEVSNSLLRMLRQFSDGLPGTWDRHYLLFQWQDSFFILDQRTYIILFLGIFSLILLILLIRPHVYLARLRSVLPHLWQIPLVFSALFLFLYGATMLLQTLLDWRNFPSLWEYYPALFLGLKLSAALFSYYLLFVLFRRMPLMRWSTFYVAASLLVTGGLTFLSLATGLANSFYFLWSLVITVLFSLWNNRYWRLGLLFLLPLWLIKAVGESFLQSPDEVLIRAVLFSPVEGNLILALFTLPMVNLLSAYHFMSHQKQGRNEQAWNEAFMALTALASLVLVLEISRAQPYGDSHRVPLVWQDDQNLHSREIRVSSPLPWKATELSVPGHGIPLLEGMREAVYDAPLLKGVQVKVKTRDYLERRDWSLELESPGAPDSVRLKITSPEPLIIRNSTFPYRISPGERDAEIYIGRFPPSPLSMVLTLAPVSRLDLEWILEYDRLPYEVQGLPPDVDFQGSLRIRYNQSLKGTFP